LALPYHTAARRDIAPELERLKLKAVARCRDHLMDRIYDMRRPKTNLQIKQSALLKYRYLAAFLRHHAPDIYAEVGRGGLPPAARAAATPHTPPMRTPLRCAPTLQPSLATRACAPPCAPPCASRCVPPGASCVRGEGGGKDAGPVPSLLGRHGKAGGAAAPAWLMRCWWLRSCSRRGGQAGQTGSEG
jgi:hypothetical protein